MWIAELRAIALRDDPERLGRFDPVRVLQWFLTSFVPGLTSVIVAGGGDIDSITVRPDRDERWIEHFYLSPATQGRGSRRSPTKSAS